ncbi:MAG: hypothetical protein DYG96_04080, partial [Chlorobi bacterium CHB2]|nr:hypothetical protein [Chlorobi bacterium CHB2]
MVKIPWNNYLPQRIANNFTTIIGASGTYLIPGTTTTNYYQMFPFTLTNNNGGNIGFPFFFLNNFYSTVQVSTQGFIGFNGANYAGYGWGWGSYPANLDRQAP